jgi:hypothetical protein
LLKKNIHKKLRICPLTFSQVHHGQKNATPFRTLDTVNYYFRAKDSKGVPLLTHKNTN